jgi:hypothetical protein
VLSGENNLSENFTTDQLRADQTPVFLRGEKRQYVRLAVLGKQPP